MTVDGALARLTAGLAEDEALARAATELPNITPKYPAKRPPWEPERWTVGRGGDVETVNGSRAPVDVGYEGGGPRSDAVAHHIVRHDPARILRQAEAIRKAVGRYDEAIARRDEEVANGSISDLERVVAESCIAAYRVALMDLAGIYTEDSEPNGAAE